MTAQAHALILASGTLAPVSALAAQLFPGSEPAAIGRFACGHVVPRERLLALALGRRGSLPFLVSHMLCWPLHRANRGGRPCSKVAGPWYKGDMVIG